MCVGCKYNLWNITCIYAVCPLYVPRKGYSPHQTSKVRFPPSVHGRSAGQPSETVASATKRSAGAGFTKNIKNHIHARKCEAMRSNLNILSPVLSPVLKPDL